MYLSTSTFSWPVEKQGTIMWFWNLFLKIDLLDGYCLASVLKVIGTFTFYISSKYPKTTRPLILLRDILIHFFIFVCWFVKRMVTGVKKI